MTSFGDFAWSLNEPLYEAPPTIGLINSHTQFCDANLHISCKPSQLNQLRAARYVNFAPPCPIAE